MRAGVCFYQRESLPGYSAIFKHPNEELNFCYYLIPCGDKPGQCGMVNVRCLLFPQRPPAIVEQHAQRICCLEDSGSQGRSLVISAAGEAMHCRQGRSWLRQSVLLQSNTPSRIGHRFSGCDAISDVHQESDLARLHNDAIKNDPFISAALGPNPKVGHSRLLSVISVGTPCSAEACIFVSRARAFAASALNVCRGVEGALPPSPATNWANNLISTYFSTHLVEPLNRSSA